MVGGERAVTDVDGTIQLDSLFAADGNRATALRVAADLCIAAGVVRLHRGIDAEVSLDASIEATLTTAEQLLAWLNGPLSIHLHAGVIRDQTTGLPSGATSTGGTMQLHDNEQFDLSASTEDAKGFETADTLTWTADDETVVTLNVSDDTKTCTVIAGAPGSTVITVTDGTNSATEAVDVITGDTTAIVLGEGAVTEQPAAA